METKNFEVFGARIVIFENGDVYVQTLGDIHVISAKQVFTPTC